MDTVNHIVRISLQMEQLHQEGTELARQIRETELGSDERESLHKRIQTNHTQIKGLIDEYRDLNAKESE